MITSRSLRSGALLGLLSVASVALPRAEAQFGARQRTPNDTLKSTEVAADHKVTFRIFAPKASEVSVGGDFGKGGKLTKDEQGIWSITVGPLVPDFYSYTFNVDGVRTVDPKNALVKQGIAGVDSMFLVPGNEADFEATRDVPFVEKNYRVQSGRENRAIAGLSMGGAQTLRVVTTHPDEFAYVGVWSAGLFGGNAAD